jgi:hypothetical protein
MQMQNTNAEEGWIKKMQKKKQFLDFAPLFQSLMPMYSQGVDLHSAEQGYLLESSCSSAINSWHVFTQATTVVI